MKKIIVGVCIKQDDKVLMVQEAKEYVYGLWNYPAGRLDDTENVFDGAIRETKEETGYDVELTGILSIIDHINGEENILKITFNANIIGGSLTFDKKELLDVKWIAIDEIAAMTDKELRGYAVGIDILNNLKQGINYPLDIIKNIMPVDDKQGEVDV